MSGLGRHDLTSEAVQTSSHPPTTKKRKLNFVKCDTCRKDKQGCRPIDREWPTKCDRCVQEGLQCSPGMKKVRKKRNNQQTYVPPPPKHRPDVTELSSQEIPGQINYSGQLLRPAGLSTSDKEDTSQPTFIHSSRSSSSSEDGSILAGMTREQISFIFFFYHMLLRARQRLDSLLQDMRNVLQDDFRTTLLKVDMKKILEFDAYIQELCYDLFWNSNIDFNDFPESLLFDIPESIIFGSRTATTKCLVCLNAFGPVEFRSWDTLNITDAFGLSFQKYFVAQTDWWARHAQHESLFESIRTDSAGCANKDGYNALLNNFEQLATQFIRKYHGIDAVPPEIQICPLFLPDEMGVYPWTRDGKLEKDCLGRTWLHQYLDSKKNTCFPWKIEEVMIKSNFQRSTCFDIDKQDIIGRTPLHIACEKGLLSFAAKLIELGADVTKQTILTMTPLHLAAASGSREIVEILLRCPRVIINAQDINGWTPFHYATRHNHASICHDIADRRMPNIICKSIVCESIDRIPMF